MPKKNKPERFLATVYKIWMMRHIDVPEEISSALMKELAKADKAKGARRGRRESRGGKSGQHANTGLGQRAPRPKYIPVVAVVNGRSARVTLVPAGGGRFRMQINTALRKAAQVDAGDVVGVDLRLDVESRELPVPADLREGLRAVPKARKAFDALTSAHRRHIIQYFDSAKSPRARQQRLERTLDALLERALLKPRHKAAKASRTVAR